MPAGPAGERPLDPTKLVRPSESPQWLSQAQARFKLTKGIQSQGAHPFDGADMSRGSSEMQRLKPCADQLKPSSLVLSVLRPTPFSVTH